MTGLALLTFLAHGETPTSEEFGWTVENAMRWLVTNQNEDGHFRGRDAHDYSQPIATYALCEAWGMTRIPAVGEAATRAVRVLIDGQQSTGGWDYSCKAQSARSDLSYAGWCVQALKAAYVAGIETSGLDEPMKRAVAGLNRHASGSGGFGYTGPGQTPLTGVAVLGLQMLGEADSPSVRAGLAWNMTGVLTGDLYLQYVEQDYDDPDFSSVDGFGIGAGLVWTPTQLTNVAIRFANTPQETTQRNASGYFSSLYSVRVQHELRRNWLLNARVSYTDNEYEVIDKDVDSLTGTQVLRAGLGLGYLINRNLYLSGGYVYQQQGANSSVYEYETNRWFVTFGAEF